MSSTEKLLPNPDDASPPYAKPGWLLEPGWFTPGVPDLDYEPQGSKNRADHRRRIEKYHHEQGKLFLKTLERGENAASISREIFRCEQARIRLLMEEIRLADDLKSEIAWRDKLDRARYERDNDEEVRMIRLANWGGAIKLLGWRRKMRPK